MIILPIKSRLQILKERENPENTWIGKNIIIFISPTPEKNAVPSSQYRATEFIRLLPIVSKKIHKKAVVRNKFRRRIKEAFRIVDQTFFKNKYDYQILAKQSIFRASVNSIKKDIEFCLSGKAIDGKLQKKEITKKKKKNKNNQIKTSEVLKMKVI